MVGHAELGLSWSPTWLLAAVLLAAGCGSTADHAAKRVERGEYGQLPARPVPFRPVGVLRPGSSSGSAVAAPVAPAGQRYVVKRIRTGSKPCATLGAAGSVWVADINDSNVKRLDPSTGRT